MKESAEEILKRIQKKFQDMEDRSMRIINADNLYEEVSRCLQSMKDKKQNIAKLNTKRGNHGRCREGFPLQYEEIDAFCLQIERGLNEVNHILFELKYFSPPPEDWTWQTNEVKKLKLQAPSDLTQEEENEIESFMLAVRFILMKQSDMRHNFRRKVTGLRKRIETLKRIMIEEKVYEEQQFAVPWKRNLLLENSAAALSFNKENARMETEE